MFQHYIVTRFNLKMNWSAAKNGMTLLGESWMNERFELFMKYCLPSVVHQTNRNFKWLVYFDTDTSPYYRNKIEELEKQYAVFEPRYIPHHDYFLSDLDAYVRDHKSRDTTHVITTRLDSDDVLHERAIAKIQDLYTSQDFQVINFQTGIRFQLEPQIQLAEFEWRTGPFLNVIEKIKSDKRIVTGYSQRHDFYVKDYEVIQVTEQPYWTQLIHDTNHTSVLQGKPIANLSVLAPFHINTSEMEVSYTSFVREKCFDMLKKVTPEIIKKRLR